MQNDSDYENQLKLIEDDTINVTQPNVLKDFVQIIIKLFLIVVLIYTTVFCSVGIVIKCLPIEKQIVLEDFMASSINIESYPPENKEKAEIEKIKNTILKYDPDFPKTSKLDVKIVKDDRMNALCLANGNIYITDSLFKKIKDDEEMLYFVIAHYKNKDHLMKLRKSIALNIISILTSIASSNKDVSKLVLGTFQMSDLNYSRHVESCADKYAGQMLLKEYKRIDGGAKALEILSSKKYPLDLNIFSTHPTIEKRIKNLRKLK